MTGLDAECGPLTRSAPACHSRPGATCAAMESRNGSQALTPHTFLPHSEPAEPPLRSSTREAAAAPPRQVK